MRYALLALLLAATNASACWWGPCHGGYLFPRLHYSYWHGGYAYGAPAYYTPSYQWHTMPYCECPPAGGGIPPQRVAPNPPVRMPDRNVPKGNAAETPYSPITPAGGTAPMEDKIPKIDLPTKPEARDFIPPLRMDELKKNDPPLIELPSAKAPPPAKLEPPKIELPPLNPSPPKIELPPLPMEKSTSKYWPSHSAQFLPVEGTAPRDGRYKVGFYNYLDRDVVVHVDGASITLPKRSSTTATVGTNFRWSLDGSEAEAAEIPAGSAGAEVVIR